MICLVIGCGSIGKRHIDNLITLGHTVYAADIDQDKIPPYTHPPTNISKGIDVVFVCTPPSVRFSVLYQYRGKHLFIEKPLAKNKEDLQSIMRSIHFTGTTMVACNMWFDPLIKTAIQVMDKGYIGKLVSVKSEFGYHTDNWPTQTIVNNPALDCVHDLDVLDRIHGDYKVRTGMSTMDDNGKVLAVDACIEFQNSIIANVHYDYLRSNKRRVIEWLGTQGTLTYEANRSVKYPGISNRLLLNDFVIEEDAPTKEAHNKPYLEQLKHFFHCIENGEETCNPLDRAYRITDLALSMGRGY